MPQSPRPLLLRLGTSDELHPVSIELAGDGVGLVVIGQRSAVLALARTLIVQLAAQGSAPVHLRADDRIAIGEVAVIELRAGESRSPPPGDLPTLILDDVPWARLNSDRPVRLRCELTSRAQFPILLEAAGRRADRSPGRHALADENGGIIATSTLIS